MAKKVAGMCSLKGSLKAAMTLNSGMGLEFIKLEIHLDTIDICSGVSVALGVLN